MNVFTRPAGAIPRITRVNLAFLIGHLPPGAFGGAELRAETWSER